MAITNYTDLQSTLADWLHRTDLGSVIPTFIQLAEGKITGDIRSRNMEVSTDLTTVAGQDYVTIPADYFSLKNLVVLSTPNYGLELITDEYYNEYNALGTTGVPRFYQIQANTIRLSPVPDSAYTIRMVYYQDLPSLSTNSTNWLLTQKPNVYLYGALVEACTYTQDFEVQQLYQAKYQEAFDNIWKTYINESFSGAPIRSYSDYVI